MTIANLSVYNAEKSVMDRTKRIILGSLSPTGQLGQNEGPE
jgi:hypothetical protein